ncbi:MAG TPA: acetylglutamate kinase [Bryobacteraceae bacterium]|jgi:acetylglutamate kinase|nr:acetylglutamate kinase [Bryobacteraceae bacterium]
MKLVIKVGGSLLDEADCRGKIARQLAEIAGKHQLVVVHGGGKQVTRFLDEHGVESQFVRGLRISDEPVLDAVLKVIAGSVNKRLVSAILAAGTSAFGLSGIDGPLTVAERMGGDLGFVGQPGPTDGKLLDLLVNAGYLPVVACIAGDRDGNIYNVNADQMAVSCARGWRAEKLFFLTDVAGVKDQAGHVLPHISPQEIGELIGTGVAHGGMQAKLEAAMAALRTGIGEVIIAPGNSPDIGRRLLAGEALGTRLSPALIPERGATA